MQRLPPAEPSAEELAIRQREGTISPNIQLALAHAPVVAQKQLELLRALSDGLSLREKEIIILRIAVLTDNSYCWGFHVRPGIRAGITEAEIRGILDRDHSMFPPKEQALLDFTTAGIAQETTDALWNAMSEGRPYEEVVKIVMLIGFYSMLGKVNAMIDVPLDPGQGEADGESWSPLVQAMVKSAAH
jgi:AhpD family alkylhydroperoxidase